MVCIDFGWVYPLGCAVYITLARKDEEAMPRKYEPLELYLRKIPSTTKEVTLSFAEIEQIIGALLPASAKSHRPWWGNQKDSETRPQAHAWLSAGFEVDAVNQGSGNASVRFRRAR